MHISLFAKVAQKSIRISVDGDAVEPCTRIFPAKTDALGDRGAESGFGGTFVLKNYQKGLKEGFTGYDRAGMNSVMGKTRPDAHARHFSASRQSGHGRIAHIQIFDRRTVRAVRCQVKRRGNANTRGKYQEKNKGKPLHTGYYRNFHDVCQRKIAALGCSSPYENRGDVAFLF